MIDLHTHSTASDGSTPPHELIRLAEEAGVTVIALTDHNTTAGLDEFVSSADGSSVRAVPGVEISCEHSGEELHVLALNLPRESFDAVEDLVKSAIKWGEASRRALTENLRAAGYMIDYNDICLKYKGSVVNRAHIASELTEKGYSASVAEAFETLLSEESGFYTPPKRLDAIDVVREIVKLGAVPVWAHPFLHLDSAGVDGILRDIVPVGLAGMEVYYTTYSEEQTAAALALTEKHRILPSGGSDFHGDIKPGIMLGIGKGNLSIPEAIAINLLG